MLRLLRSRGDNGKLVQSIFSSNNVYAIKYALQFIRTKEDVRRLTLGQTLQEMMGVLQDEKTICTVVEKMHILNALSEHLDALLWKAVEHKRFSVVRFLLLKGGDAHAIDPNGTALIQHLISLHQHGMVELLIEHYGVDVNSKNVDGENVIFSAVASNACNVSNTLIQLGTQLDCRDKHNISLIQRCIEKNWYLHFNYIVSKGGCDFLYDKALFHSYCHLAIGVNSMLIFDKLIKHFFAYTIQRHWRSCSHKHS